MIAAQSRPTLQSFRIAGLEVGTPDIVGALAVYPLLGEEARQPFVSFAEAAALGVAVTELPGASVNDLVVHNPLEVAVLLYEGEEVLGAQQNRTFDATVLVPAGARLQVPVSCVEHGRWDAAKHDEAFAPSPQAAYPELRRRKNLEARGAAMQGREARADQSAVWAEIDRKGIELEAEAPTGAMHDVFSAREEALAAAATGIARRPGQLGAIAVADGKPLAATGSGGRRRCSMGRPVGPTVRPPRRSVRPRRAPPACATQGAK